MDIEYPSYYEEFHCIASSCKDSCCRGWCIDVDEDSREYYNRVEGRFGDKLRETLKEEKGNYFFPLKENGDCPFLLRNGLCEMICELGEETLCNVCASYPRMKRSYGNYAQYDLNASCEEAFRLILNWDGEILRGREEMEGEEKLSPDKEKELVHLLAFRSALWEEIPYFPKDFNGFFSKLFAFFWDAELTIYPDSLEGKNRSGEIEKLCSKIEDGYIFSFLTKERFREALVWQKKIKEKNKDFSIWRELFVKEAQRELQENSLIEYYARLSKEKKEDLAQAIPVLCQYFLFRYMLMPLEEASLLPLFSLIYQSIEWIYTAYLLVHHELMLQDGANPSEFSKGEKKIQFSCFFSEEPSILRIAVFFSKEIEHDEDNLRQLLSYIPLSKSCEKGV